MEDVGILELIGGEFPLKLKKKNSLEKKQQRIDLIKSLMWTWE